MIVVPLEKDKVLTKDDQLLRVIEYTNYKDGGPAVYCKTKDSTDPILIYFFDIAEINGVRVEYSKSTRMFTSLGKIIRAQHLPQPDDKVMIGSKGERKEVTVASIKLKSKSQGHNRGLLIKDEEDDFYRMKDITGIDNPIGTDKFNRADFLKIYHDYLGV